MDKLPKKIVKKRQASSSQLYYCEHCKKWLTYKTFCRHKKLFLREGIEQAVSRRQPLEQGI